MATTDYAGGSVEMKEDLRWYFGEVGKVDAAIATIESLDTPGEGHGERCDPAS